jgi:hypothetical protein
MTFKKGESGNPAGRPPLPAELKHARKFTKDRYEATLHKISGMSMQELLDFVKGKQGDVLETAIASVWLKAITKGDHKRIQDFTSRMIGPIPKHINLTAGSIAELMLMFNSEAEGGSSDGSDARLVGSSDSDADFFGDDRTAAEQEIEQT